MHFVYRPSEATWGLGIGTKALSHVTWLSLHYLDFRKNWRKCNRIFRMGDLWVSSLMESIDAISWPDFGATAGCSISQTPEPLKPVVLWLLNPSGTILCLAELKIGSSTGDWIALLCNKSEDWSHRSWADLPTWTLKWLWEVSIISLPKGSECNQWAVSPNNKLLQFSTTKRIYQEFHLLAWLVFRQWLPLYFKYFYSHQSTVYDSWNQKHSQLPLTTTVKSFERGRKWITTVHLWSFFLTSWLVILQGRNGEIEVRVAW